MKVESTAGLVMLVSDHQRDEELVNRAVKEKLLMAVHKDASKLVVYAVSLTPSECLYALLVIHVSHALALAEICCLCCPVHVCTCLCNVGLRCFGQS